MLQEHHTASRKFKTTTLQEHHHLNKHKKKPSRTINSTSLLLLVLPHQGTPAEAPQKKHGSMYRCSITSLVKEAQLVHRLTEPQQTKKESHTHKKLLLHTQTR
jgi:hypothetical protein